MIIVNELVFYSSLKLKEEIVEAEAVSKGSKFHADMALGKKECKNCDESIYVNESFRVN